MADKKITSEAVRNDLKDIRYYYARKEVFEYALKFNIENKVLRKINIYNKAIKEADPMLFDFYVSVYVKGYTLASYSEICNYSYEYVRRVNGKMIDFLRNKLQEAKYE